MYHDRELGLWMPCVHDGAWRLFEQAALEVEHGLPNVFYRQWLEARGEQEAGASEDESLARWNHAVQVEQMHWLVSQIKPRPWWLRWRAPCQPEPMAPVQAAMKVLREERRRAGLIPPPPFSDEELRQAREELWREQVFLRRVLRFLLRRQG